MVWILEQRAAVLGRWGGCLMGVNNLCITGHLGIEPEEVKGERRTFARCRIAAHQIGKDKPSLWLDVTAWSQWAIPDLLRCSKGDKVTVSGRLECREWTGRDGEKRSSWGISIDQIDRHAPPEKIQPQRPVELPADDDLPF